MTATLRALIFDVDGTLAETEEGHRAAFNQAFAEAGHAWSWTPDEYRRLLKVTGGKERIRSFLDEMSVAAGDDEIAALHGRKNAIYAEQMKRGGIALRPGVARLIAEARHIGLKLAIATTTSRTNIEALLSALLGDKSLGWFAAIVTGEDVAHKKPDPEVYLRALEALGLAAEDCIAIEDSRNGLDAALACGLPTLVTPSRYTSDEQFPGAMLVCDDLDCSGQPIDVARLRAALASCARLLPGAAIKLGAGATTVE